MNIANDTEPGTPLLFARVLDGKGGGRAIDWAGIQNWEPGEEGQMLWMHLCRNSPGVYDWLQDHIGVPEPTAELLTSDQTRPRAFREGNTLVATLRGINFNPGAQPEDMISMQVWSDGVHLITLRRHPLQTPRQILAQIDRGAGPPDAGAIVTALTEDERLSRRLLASPHVERLNFGPIPTNQISWDQPHEGNLFEHLYRQRALQHF